MIHICHITHTDTHRHHTVIQNIINNEKESKEASKNQIKSNKMLYNDDDNDNDKYYDIKSITLMKYHTERHSREI